MSSSIDKRIVEMQFDNQQFERGIDTSIKSLDKLDSALALENANKGVSAAQKAINGFDVSSMTNSVGMIGKKFSAMEIAAITAISNVANRLTNLGINISKSLTIDQITAGWSKFEEKTQSVQTIMAATGKTVDEVGLAMDKLNWYTDETSYSFTDMANNIGKFTSQNIELDKANIAMQGIANWAALSGQNAASASRAMYNISQAIGVGSMKLMDWKSIQNANMATAEFKETAIQTALAMGTLKKAGDKIFTKKGGMEVNIQNFSETLAKGWFNTDVLMKTLEKYGNFGNRLQEITKELTNDVGEEVFTATDLLNVLKEFEGTDLSNYISTDGPTMQRASEIAEEYGVNVEDLIKYIDELNGEEYELGKRAFKAAQEAKTFSDALNATKDAVSTGWMNTFEKIFGNYEEAKEWWTYFTNDVLWEIFASSAAARNSMLSFWQSFGGRDALIGDENSALHLFLDNLVNIVSISKESFHDFFSPLSGGASEAGKKLYDFTLGLKSFAEWLYLDDEALANIKNGLNILWAPLNVIKSAVSSIFSIIGALSDPLKEIFNYSLSSASDLGLFLKNISDSLSGSMLEGVNKIKEIFAFYKEFTEGIKNGGNAKLFDNEQMEKYIPIFAKINRVLDIIKSVIDSIKNSAEAAAKVFGDFAKGISPVFGDIANVGYELFRLLGPISVRISELMNSIKNSDAVFNFARGLANIVHFVSEEIISFIHIIKDVLGDPLNKIIGYIGDASEKFKDFWNSINNSNSDDSVKKITFVEKVLNSLGKVLDFIKKLIGKINLSSVVDLAKTIIESVTTLITSLIKTLKESMSDGSLAENIVTVVNGVLSSVFLTKGSGLLGTLNKFLGNGQSLLEKAKGAIQSFVGFFVPQMKEVQSSLNPSGLMQLATALAILSGALFILSSVDTNKLAGAVVALEALFVMFSKSMVSLSLVEDPKQVKTFKKISGSLVKLAAAMLILSLSLKQIASIDTSKLFTSVAALGLLLNMLASFSSKLDGKKVNIKGMISLAASMLIFALAMKSIAKMEWASIGKSLLVIGTILGTIAAFSKLTNGASLKGGSLIAVALSLVTFGLALKVIATLDLASLAKSIGAIWAILLGLGVASKTVDAARLLAISAAMTVFSISLGLLIPSLYLLGNMKLSKIGKSLLIIAGTIAVLAVSSKLLAASIPSMLAFAGTLALFGGSMLLVGVGITALSVGLTSLATAISVSGGAIVLGIKLILETILRMVPDMAKAFGESVIEFVSAIISKASVLIDAVVVLGESIFSAIERLVPGLLRTILNVLRSIGSNIGPIVDEVISIILTVIDRIGANIVVITDRIIVFVAKLLDGVARAIVENSDILLTAMGNILKSILYFVLETLQSFTSYIPFIGGEINGWLEDIKGNLKLKDIAEDAGEETVNAFDSGLEKNEPKVASEAEDVKDIVIDELSDLKKEATSTGENAASGLASGLANNENKVLSKARNLANKVMKTLNDSLKIKSPSRLTRETGMYLDEGLALGIDDYTKVVTKSTTALTDTVFNSVSDPISQISTSFADNADLTPTITPVIDMSNVDSSARRIGSMFSDNYSISLSDRSVSGSIARTINVQNSSSNLSQAVSNLNSNISTLKNSLNNTKIVLDSGALVGNTVSKIDDALGRLYSYKERGAY